MILVFSQSPCAKAFQGYSGSFEKNIISNSHLNGSAKTFQVFVCYTNAIYPPFKYSCFYLHIYLVVKHNLVFDSNLVVYYRTTWRICQPKLDK